MVPPDDSAPDARPPRLRPDTMGDMKTVGRRRVDGTDVRILQRTMAALRGTNALVPRGVYRFATSRVSRSAAPGVGRHVAIGVPR